MNGEQPMQHNPNQQATALGYIERGPIPPTPANFPGNYQVTINRVENGFMVHVGCKTFVSQSLTEIFDGLNLYFTKPEEAMKKYTRDFKS